MLEIASPRKSLRGLADLCPVILRPEGLRQQHRQSPSSQACSPRSNWCLAENSNRLSFRDKIGFLLAKIFGMRKTISEPSFLGSTDIGAVKPNAKSRDDISALLIGFQATYADGAVPLHPEARIIPGCRLDTVRTGSAFLDGSVSDLSASEDGLQDSGGLLSSGPDFA